MDQFFSIAVVEEIIPRKEPGSNGVIWYPSIGNRQYPYSEWPLSSPESVWDLLEGLGNSYHYMCRQLRNLYKWSPHVMDEIEVHRLIQIFNESVEDNKNGDTEQEYNY